MARLGTIETDQLPAMQVLETLSAETIIAARMARFVQLWNEHDPPVAASYDVSNLEFDPIKIVQEANTYFELLVRDRINQAAKSVTLAFASGADLDAIASRYPGGVPRLTGESDDHYRMRVWMSPNTLSPNGSYESYVFWAMTALPALRDVTATAVPGNPEVTVTLMADGTPVTATNGIITVFPDPRPAADDITAVMTYIGHDLRRAMTDVPVVRAPKVVHVDYVIDIWLFPGWDKTSLMNALAVRAAALIELQRWLGYSHTVAAIDGALKIGGVFNVKVRSPVADVIIDQHSVVQVDSVTLNYIGRSGFEEPVEPA